MLRSKKMRLIGTGSARIRIVVGSSRRRAFDSKLGRKEPDPLNEKPQVDMFRDLARELETDDDEARIDERLKKLAAVKPKAAKSNDGKA